MGLQKNQYGSYALVYFTAHVLTVIPKSTRVFFLGM